MEKKMKAMMGCVLRSKLSGRMLPSANSVMDGVGLVICLCTQTRRDFSLSSKTLKP